MASLARVCGLSITCRLQWNSPRAESGAIVPAWLFQLHSAMSSLVVLLNLLECEAQVRKQRILDFAVDIMFLITQFIGVTSAGGWTFVECYTVSDQEEAVAAVELGEVTAEVKQLEDFLCDWALFQSRTSVVKIHSCVDALAAALDQRSQSDDPLSFTSLSIFRVLHDFCHVVLNKFRESGTSLSTA